MKAEFKLPQGINPQTPIGNLTFEQIKEICAAAAPLLGFSLWTPESRAAHGKLISDAKRNKMTPERRREIALAASDVRWAAVRAAKAAAKTE